MNAREIINRIEPWIVMHLSRAEYYADFFITPPLTVLLLVLGLRGAHSTWWPIEIVIGWSLWTAYEYALHRWILHGASTYGALHALHHVEERDHVALHPLATIAGYALTWLVFGVRTSMVAVGFSLGYVTYAALHTIYHHMRIRVGHPLYHRWRRHGLHHRDPSTCYGVTTSLWDRLGGTEHPRAM